MDLLYRPGKDDAATTFVVAGEPALFRRFSAGADLGVLAALPPPEPGLRLAGHEPVPAIYGPSGDVTWDQADPTYSMEAAKRGVK